MKKIAFLLLSSFFLFSCVKDASLTVKNNVSSVTISQIKWGKESLGGSLIPGESIVKNFRGSDLDYPESHKITFRMSANNQEVFLETVEEYTLNKEENKTIVIDDDTAVINPG